MTAPNISAVVGVSGVGKSAAIAKAKSTLPLLHLQASVLLKSGFMRAGEFVTSDDLRLGDVTSNQNILIAEFWRQIGQSTLPIVFDGHVIIEGKSGREPIKSEVFEKLKIRRLIFLHAPPEEIQFRRQSDIERRRPLLPVDAVDNLQKYAADYARTVAFELQVPFYMLEQGDFRKLKEAVSGTLDRHKIP